MIECQNFLIGRWVHSATLDADYKVVICYKGVFQFWNFKDEKVVEVTTEIGMYWSAQYHYYAPSRQLILFRADRFCTVNSPSFYVESYIVEVVDQSTILLIDPDLIVELRRI